MKSLRFLSVSLILVFFNSLESSASTQILGFNWGSSQGVRDAVSAAQQDAMIDQRGFRIGRNFWNSLRQSQDDADHQAGDGLYFSTQPLDSSRFGPSLMIVEIEIENPTDPKILKVLTAEQAQAHPDRLPTIVRYRGSWHVIKSLPTHNKVKIWIREPKIEDVERIFIQFKLDSDIIKVLDLIVYIGHRYNWRFRPFDSRGSIPVDQQANKSTKRFMEKLLEQLVEKGLNMDPSILLDSEKKRLFRDKLSHTLSSLGQQENQKKIYGFNMKKLLYKKFLSQPIDWPEDILETFDIYDKEYFQKYRSLGLEARKSVCQNLF